MQALNDDDYLYTLFQLCYFVISILRKREHCLILFIFRYYFLKNFSIDVVSLLYLLKPKVHFFHIIVNLVAIISSSCIFCRKGIRT
uniref:Uncharacterized protein n=1 Tax=Octopus bimaculoides TaxID=37653 RepID=A0A0L8FJT4_OCTBM